MGDIDDNEEDLDIEDATTDPYVTNLLSRIDNTLLQNQNQDNKDRQNRQGIQGNHRINLQQQQDVEEDDDEEEEVHFLAPHNTSTTTNNSTTTRGK